MMIYQYFSPGAGDRELGTWVYKCLFLFVHLLSCSSSSLFRLRPFTCFSNLIDLFFNVPLRCKNRRFSIYGGIKPLIWVWFQSVGIRMFRIHFGKDTDGKTSIRCFVSEKMRWRGIGAVPTAGTSGTSFDASSRAANPTVNRVSSIFEGFS